MNENTLPVIGIVAPCYNEQEVFSDSLEKLLALIRDYKIRGVLSEDSFIAFVDDGSKDRSW